MTLESANFIISAKDMINEPIGIHKTSTIIDAIKKLCFHKISRLVVMDSGKPVGIISEKDLCFFILNDKTGRNLHNVNISEIIHNLIFVDPDTPVTECAKIMIQKGVSSLTVKTNERTFGIFTKTDLVKYFIKHYSQNNKVVDYMNSHSITEISGAPLYQILSTMIQAKISRIIMTDYTYRPLGMITLKDFFKLAIEYDKKTNQIKDNILDEFKKSFASEDGYGVFSLGSEIMTKKIFHVKYDAGLKDAGKILLDKKVSGIAVTSKNNTLIGIISKTDIVRALSESNWHQI